MLRRKKPLSAKTPLKRGTWKKSPAASLKRSTGLGKGKKTSEWDHMRAELKPRFAKIGLTSCELRLDGCWRTNGLGFCHAVKRRYLDKNAMKGSPCHIETVILGCSVCHQQIESKTHLEMREIVMETIKKRTVQP